MHTWYVLIGISKFTSLSFFAHPTLGPAEKLNATAVCQPAMYMSSLAALQQAPADVLQRCSAVAGLSLGEYTALAFAGMWNNEKSSRGGTDH